MTTELTFERLRLANKTRCGSAFHPIDEWNPLEWGGAAAGEVGELLNILKKVKRGDFTLESATPEIAKEIADAIIYLDLLAERCNINLGHAVIQKFNEVSARRGSTVVL